jgi:hypothetical protein
MSSTQPTGADRRPPRSHLLVLNRSFRRTLEAENKSPRTMQAYTDAVRLLATYCQAHSQPLLVNQLQREHIHSPSSPTSWPVGSRPPPTTATGACTPSSSGQWPRATWRPAPWTACDRPSSPINPSTSSGPSTSPGFSRPAERARASHARLSPPTG